MGQLCVHPHARMKGNAFNLTNAAVHLDLVADFVRIVSQVEMMILKRLSTLQALDQNVAEMRICVC